MSGASKVADWVRDNLDLMEQTVDSPVAAAEFVRLGDSEVLIHAPSGRSFSVTVREITGEVDRG